MYSSLREILADIEAIRNHADKYDHVVRMSNLKSEMDCVISKLKETCNDGWYMDHVSYLKIEK